MPEEDTVEWSDEMNKLQKEVLENPHDPPCLGRYMEMGNYVDAEGDWWAHYCGSAVCPRAYECHAKTQDKRKADRDRRAG